MAHLPDHLPRSEADLVDWSVYADELMHEGDPLGEFIAQDLATAPLASKQQQADFQRLAKKLCWTKRKTTDAGWSLGHIRQLALKPFDRELDGATIANVTKLLGTPVAGLVEHLSIVTTAWNPALARLMKALPARCRSLTLAFTSLEPLQFRFVGADLPPQIEELSLYTRELADWSGVIDDRYRAVEMFGRSNDPGLARALDRTSRVVFRTLTLPAGLHPRIVVPDGAGFIEAFPKRAHAIVPTPLVEVQAKAGIVPIRVQLSRFLTEHYRITFERGHVTLQRRDGRWTVHMSPSWKIHGGTDTLGEVLDGSVLETDFGRVTFYAHDLAARAKAM
ncbi:MAG: hypothetical protein QM831_01670 [Kofleriaceae bacterium]